MKKRLAVFAALVLASVSMTACNISLKTSVDDGVSSAASAAESSKAEESKAEESKAEESQAEESKDEESKAEESQAEESKDEESKSEESEAEESKVEVVENENPLLNWKVKIDDVEYTIPCDYKVFKENGWMMSDEDTDLEFDTYEIGCYLEKNEEKLSINYWNPYTEVKNFSECKIGQVMIYANDGIKFELPKGLVFSESTTAADVINLYGEPSYKDEEETYTVLVYEADIYSSVEFMIYSDPEMVGYSSVTIQNLV